MLLVPKKAFLTRGCGTHKEKLASFEAALREAGISHLNLVEVSSIFPPYCELVSRTEGLRLLQPGAITHVVLSRNQDNEFHRSIAAAVGIAIPQDRSHYGYVSEHHSFGQTRKEAGDYAEDLAASMLATTLGIQFDPNTNYDEKKAIYRMSGKIVTSRNTTATAVCQRGAWTTVVAALVFIP